MINLLVLFGGESGEHEVSLCSAASILSNIHKDKYNIIKVGITKKGEWRRTDAAPQEIESGEWEKNAESVILSPDTAHRGLLYPDGRVEKIDVAFPAMHGTYCEDGCVQGLFELAGIRYVGAGVFSSAVAMDKSATKLFAAAAGIPQADWLVIEAPFAEEAIQRIEDKLSYPFFMKPCNAGSSLGVSKVKRREDVRAAVEKAAEYDTRILCEEFIDGREIECSVLGNQEPEASCTGEIIPSGEFYDYNAKYIDDASGLSIPAQVPQETSESIREYAVRIYKALRCRGLSRVDFFVHRQTGKVYFNEINTLPGFTKISMYPKLWAHSGVKYADLIDRLIEYAL